MNLRKKKLSFSTGNDKISECGSDREITKKGTLQANINHEHRFRNPKQDISLLKPVVHTEANTSGPRWLIWRP